MDEPFSVRELELALSSSHSSTLVQAGIFYSTFTHLGVTARDKLLNLHYETWATDVVPSFQKKNKTSRAIPALKAS